MTIFKLLQIVNSINGKNMDLSNNEIAFKIARDNKSQFLKYGIGGAPYIDYNELNKLICIEIKAHNVKILHDPDDPNSNLIDAFNCSCNY